jgi:hypothetical protein
MSKKTTHKNKKNNLTKKRIQKKRKMTKKLACKNKSKKTHKQRLKCKKRAEK